MTRRRARVFGVANGDRVARRESVPERLIQRLLVLPVSFRSFSFGSDIKTLRGIRTRGPETNDRS
jgi:hypothetical protein